MRNHCFFLFVCCIFYVYECSGQTLSSAFESEIPASKTKLHILTHYFLTILNTIVCNVGWYFKGSIINEFENLTFNGTICVRYVSILAYWNWPIETLLANEKIMYKVPDVLHCLANIKKMFKVEGSCKWSIYVLQYIIARWMQAWEFS